MYMRVTISVWLGFFVAGMALNVFAQYPVKPIRFINPTSPGGVSDNLARLLSQKLSVSFKQQLVVDSRPGAAGIIAAELAARSTPDGYTIFMGNLGTHAINPALHDNLPYDPLGDFNPVALIADVPELLVVHPSVPGNNVLDFITYAKKKPGELNYSSAGIGTTTHLSMELFSSMASIKLTHVPYKGGVPALTDLIAGRVQAMFPNISVSLPHVRAGKLKALGVTTATRTSLFPDLQTISESGLPGFVVSQWFGVFVPARTPRAIVAKLHSALDTALRDPEVKRAYEKQGADVAFNSPQEFAVFVKSEHAKWLKVVREAGVSAQ